MFHAFLHLFYELIRQPQILMLELRISSRRSAIHRASPPPTCKRTSLCCANARLTQHFAKVLHFSILRFVFDLESLTRKKSKHAIKFPTTVDISKFITRHCDAHPADGTSSKTCSCPSSDSSSEVYELRGILLHKGTSAYHGHYEAKVFDVMFVIY